MTEEIGAFALPEGRLINGHLFVRQVYKDDKGREGKPNYSAEMVFEQGQLGEFEKYLENVMVAQFGQEKFNQYEKNGWVRWPIRDGDKKAARRKANGKNGEAYEGKDVVSASSLYNKNGDEADGGIEVFDAEVNPIEPVNKSEVFNGSFGCAAVKGKAYERTGDDGDPIMSVVLYLEAYQKTRDGDRLAQKQDRTALFKKAGGGESSGNKGDGRRRD